ncbi:MAG TPA: PH domain-containing protein [Thermodesulfobacteriota bacterium]|nr:PH domain-containing protein [Thermodesulfobacteriota bacterium]
MAIAGVFKGLVEKLQGGSFTEPPDGIAEGLRKRLGEGEEVLFTLLNWRAMRKAPTFTDSNTYFSSWFILTAKRIIIARNSSELKTFREIPLNGITDIHYELDRSEPRVTITTPGNVDKIEFQKRAAGHASELEGLLKAVIAEARRSAPVAAEGEIVLCGGCGSGIPKTSRFCPECGVRIILRDSV